MLTVASNICNGKWHQHGAWCRGVLAALCAGGVLVGESVPGWAGTSGGYVQKRLFSRVDAHFLYPGGSMVLSVNRLSQPDERIVALSFDDGPTGTDHALASVLREHGVPASFFYVGDKIAGRGQIVKAMVAEGHEVGLHGYHHVIMSRLSDDAQMDAMRSGLSALSSIGVVPRWFRPPYGSFNESTVQSARKFGMETVLWSVDTRDWTGVSAATIAQRVLGQIHAGGVVLMHSNKPQTVAALPQIITTARAQGYRFVTLSEWQKVIVAANCRADGNSCAPSGNAGSVVLATDTAVVPPVVPVSGPPGAGIPVTLEPVAVGDNNGMVAVH
jgi:peptidoglycan/xylan/chitin deacetylase (PgdA/CDA1 family)